MLHVGILLPVPIFTFASPSACHSASGYKISSKSYCIENFGAISQLLLRVSKNKSPPCWNSTFGSDFYVCVTIGMLFCICLPNFVQIGLSATELWRHIHFSTRWPRHRNFASLLLVSVFVTSLICEGRNLPAHYIFVWHLNPRLRYYYSRFLKTNVCHVGILLPVPISTFASSSTCHSASACQISSKSDHLRQSYDVISIFQHGDQFYFRFRFS